MKRYFEFVSENMMESIRWKKEEILQSIPNSMKLPQNIDSILLPPLLFLNDELCGWHWTCSAFWKLSAMQAWKV